MAQGVDPEFKPQYCKKKKKKAAFARANLPHCRPQMGLMTPGQFGQLNLLKGQTSLVIRSAKVERRELKTAGTHPAGRI
jgi:hypothetical protein